MTLFVPILLILVAGGFEHVFGLSQLTTLEIDGFWDAFEDVPLEVSVTHNLQAKLGYLRERLEACAEPLL